jgi:alkylation response protein AidB-like acyl-CoA dehydrogenase
VTMNPGSRAHVDHSEGPPVAVPDDVVDWLARELPESWFAAVVDGRAIPDGVRESVDTNILLRRLGEAGFVVPDWPAEYGGRNASPEEARIILETLRRFHVPQPDDFVGVNLAGPTLLAWGTDGQRRRFLPAIAQRTKRWCQLFSEPGAGSDLAALTTKARLGDDQVWIVSGQKVWTSLAHNADLGILLARTEPDQPRHLGLSYFVVDMKAQGVDVRPLRQISGESHFCEVFLDEVRIRDDCRVGPRGHGWEVTLTTLMNERVGLSMVPEVHHVTADRLVAAAMNSGDWSRPVLRDRVLRLLQRDRVLGLTNMRAAELRRAGSEGPDGSLLKLAQSVLSRDIAYAAIDVLGLPCMAWSGAEPGDVEATRLAFLYAPAHTIAGGTSEIQRNIIAERLLGLPREPRS